MGNNPNQGLNRGAEHGSGLPPHSHPSSLVEVASGCREDFERLCDLVKSAALAASGEEVDLMKELTVIKTKHVVVTVQGRIIITKVKELNPVDIMSIYLWPDEVVAAEQELKTRGFLLFPRYYLVYNELAVGLLLVDGKALKGFVVLAEVEDE